MQKCLSLLSIALLSSCTETHVYTPIDQGVDGNVTQTCTLGGPNSPEKIGDFNQIYPVALAADKEAIYVVADRLTPHDVNRNVYRISQSGQQTQLLSTLDASDHHPVVVDEDTVYTASSQLASLRSVTKDGLTARRATQIPTDRAVGTVVSIALLANTIYVYEWVRDTGQSRGYSRINKFNLQLEHLGVVNGADSIPEVVGDHDMQTADGSIYLATRQGVYELPEAGGPARNLTSAATMSGLVRESDSLYSVEKTDNFYDIVQFNRLSGSGRNLRTTFRHLVSSLHVAPELSPMFYFGTRNYFVSNTSVVGYVGFTGDGYPYNRSRIIARGDITDLATTKDRVFFIADRQVWSKPHANVLPQETPFCDLKKLDPENICRPGVIGARFCASQSNRKEIENSRLNQARFLTINLKDDNDGVFCHRGEILGEAIYNDCSVCSTTAGTDTSIGSFPGMCALSLITEISEFRPLYVSGEVIQ